jgi:hypothetical protein
MNPKVPFLLLETVLPWQLMEQPTIVPPELVISVSTTVPWLVMENLLKLTVIQVATNYKPRQNLNNNRNNNFPKFLAIYLLILHVDRWKMLTGDFTVNQEQQQWGVIMAIFIVKINWMQLSLIVTEVVMIVPTLKILQIVM